MEHKSAILPKSYNFFFWKLCSRLFSCRKFILIKWLRSNTCLQTFLSPKLILCQMIFFLKEHLLFIITWLTSLLLPGLCSVIMFPWKSFPAPKCDLSYLLGDIIPQQNSYSTVFPHFSALWSSPPVGCRYQRAENCLFLGWYSSK